MRSGLPIVVVVMAIMLATVVSAPVPEVAPSYCVAPTANGQSPDSCYPSLTEFICVNDLQGTYYVDGEPPGDYPPLACTWGCCVNPQTLIGEEMYQISCPFGGDDFTPGTCDGVAVTYCEQGETDCVCEDIIIGEGQFCCDGSISNEACEPHGGGGGGVCGDGIWDRELGEICDPGAPPPLDIGYCEPLDNQACTINCRCALYETDGDPDYCSQPGDPLCEPEPCDEGGLEITEAVASPIPGMPAAHVQWAVSTSTCDEEEEGITVEYTDITEGTNQNIDLEAGAREIDIDDLKAGHQYEFRITLEYEDGTLVTITAVPSPLWIPEQRCLAGQDSWCVSDTEYLECGDDGITGPTSCGGNTQCYDSSEGAVCLQAGVCDACNGGYDSFGEVVGDDRYLELDNWDSLACSNAANFEGTDNEGNHFEELTFCFLDAAYSAAYMYQSCGAVDSCEDYKTHAACSGEDVSNPCHIFPGCEWNAALNYCENTDPQIYTCETEDQDVCEALPQCWWNSEQCRPIDGTCNDYRTRADCIGTGQDWDMIASTHEGNPYSQDRFAYGKCGWDESRSVCFKNADLDNSSELDNDFTDPVTTLLFNPENPVPAGSSIRYAVTEAVQTYANLEPGACYRVYHTNNHAIVNDETRTIDLPTDLEAGEHCLTFWTKDMNSNMEITQQQTIIITRDPDYILEVEGIDIDLFPYAQGGTTDVEIRVNLTTVATCDMTIGGRTTPRIEGLTSDRFYMIARDLPDGSYPLRIACENQYGTLDEEYPIVLDTDTRINESFPVSPPTFRRAQIPQFGVHTQEPGTCEYKHDNTWHDLPIRSTIGQGPLTRYRHAAPGADLPPGAGEYFRFPVRCTFERSPGPDLVLDGGPGDAIRIALDDEAPVTTIEVDREVIETNPTNIPAPDGEITLNITCADVSIPGENQQWESGVDRIEVDGGEGWTELTTSSYTLQSEEHVKIRCIDALGNTETPAWDITATPEDEGGPLRPVFEVVE